MLIFPCVLLDSTAAVLEDDSMLKLNYSPESKSPDLFSNVMAAPEKSGLESISPELRQRLQSLPHSPEQGLAVDQFFRISTISVSASLDDT